ncbi:MAG: hypothetical protein RLY31_299 [Bacteroidota bacterium]
MICHTYKCIFIHQRKCAGTSIIRQFGYSLQDAEWHAYNDGVLSEEPPWSDVAARYPDYLVFAVVRNPWDRFVSGWKYLAATRDRPLLDVLRQLPAEGHDYRHLTRPQTDTLLDRDGRFVTGFLLRFERLQEDFDALCQRLGMPPVILPVENATERRDYRRYFHQRQARELFEKIYWRDIQRLGYTFSERASRTKWKLPVSWLFSGRAARSSAMEAQESIL